MQKIKKLKDLFKLKLKNTNWKLRKSENYLKNDRVLKLTFWCPTLQHNILEPKGHSNIGSRML
jgi:hypothetical protein